MKKHIWNIAFFLILAGILFGCSYVFSQPRDQRPPMLPDSTHIVQRVDEMAEALSLSDQQKQNILNLHFEHFDQLKQMMQKEKKNREANREKHEEMKSQFETSILELLSDEQKTGFESFQKTHQPPRPPQQGNCNRGQMKREQKMPKRGTQNENAE